MDDLFRQITGILVAMWSRRWFGLAAAWAVSLLAMAAVTMVIRDRYEASAKVFVDTQTVLKPLMSGLAFQPDVDQQVRMLARTLISRPNVERLISSPRVGLQGLSPSDREKTIDRLTREIKVAPSGDANLFAITYRDINPQRAQIMVDELVSLFVSSGVTDKQRDSEQARRFLDDQIKSYEAKLTESENRLKDFKLRNFGLPGTSNQDYFARMSAATEEVNRLKIELQASEQARDALRRELSQEDPSMPVEAMMPGMVPIQSDTEARLDAQQSQLEQARSMAGRMPEVEAELTQLNRDYDIVRKNYEQLVARRESASLGEKIDLTTKVADFRVVEPPRVSPTPAKPSRMLVSVMGFLAAIAAGAGIAFALTQVFPTVQDSRGLREIGGRPILGSASLVISPQASDDVRRANHLFFGLTGLFVIVNVFWLIVIRQNWLP